MSDIVFVSISPFHPDVPSLLSLSIGNVTDKKLQQVLQEYSSPYHFLTGCFKRETLIGVIGYQFTANRLLIRHLSVHSSWQRQGIGRALIDFIIQDKKATFIVAETDSQSVEFYCKIGFSCREIVKNGYPRFKCERIHS